MSDPKDYLMPYAKTLQAELNDFLKNADNPSAGVTIGYSAEYVLITIQLSPHASPAPTPTVYCDPDNSPVTEVREYLQKRKRGMYFCEVFHPAGVGLVYGDVTLIAKEPNPKLFTYDRAVSDFWKWVMCHWTKSFYWHEGKMITRSLKKLARLSARDGERLTSVIKRMLSGRGVLIKDYSRSRHANQQRWMRRILNPKKKGEKR